jgi:ABC-type branched-subunit amino acid transport system substrate-binding protein/DNA-binding beta-propeller fold protein YncE/predicted Ser/Thr protein kinase
VPLELTPGSTFAHYRIEGLVGRGGMGVVYRASDLRLERPVALKLIAPELAEDERFRERFLRESRVAASLDHRGVVPIHEAGEEAGQLFIAMRYVEGEDLKTLLEREGTLAPERALSILSQVADALDAAHEKGLVHRDVKPGNVLLDSREHAYLTDFGLTKQLGGASTETGQVVGTFAYLAPEQIRGEAVDRRTDCYALACVLYECLGGHPPFRRSTEAETLWAHMQEEPPSLRAYPELAPVLQKALAKEKNDRYASCGDFLAAAASALGLEAPARRARRRLIGRRLVVAGAAVIVAAAATVAGVLLAGDGSELAAPGNAVAAVDPSGERVVAYTEVGRAPGNVAVGEGAVWVLNTEDETVSQIDPDTKEVVKTFKPGGTPSEIAAGEGALWIGNAGGRDVTNPMVSVSQIDPASSKVTRTVNLPGGGSDVLPSAGLPRLAVGAGAVWAINPDGSVSRIEPESGRLERIDVAFPPWTIAAGDEGVWFLSVDRGSSVFGIDPRTRSVSEIEVGTHFLWGVTVGAGSVWATAQGEGLLWRIEPGPNPVTRTIDVGAGVTFVDFGEGAVWTGNYADGRVSRIDPRTNTVTARISFGTPQALAAGAGGAWVSVAGGTTEGALTTTACGEVASGGGRPDVLIVSDLPLQGPGSAEPRALAAAIRFALERRGFRAGDHTVGYQSCDHSTPQTGGFEFRKCAANATAYAHAEQLVGVIGPYSSFCAGWEIPILNRAPGGAVAMISPSNTHTGLTREHPVPMFASVGYEGEPEVFYPTGVRNFFRVVPPEDLQGVAHAMLAQQLGLKRVYVLHDGASSDWKLEHADPFRTAARRLGLRVVGVRAFDRAAKSHDALVQNVARSRAQGVFVAGLLDEGGDRVLKALHAGLGNRVKVMVADTFIPITRLLELAGPAARGVYVSATDVPPAARDLSPEAERFARDFGAFGTPVPYALPAAQAAEVLLQAIARSDGTRASVLAELRATKVRDGLLGSFRFDRNGDITPAAVPIFRVIGATAANAGVFDLFRGAVVDRVVHVPARLAG